MVPGNSTRTRKSDEMMSNHSLQCTAFIVLKEHTPMLLGLLSDPDKLSDELWAKELLSDVVIDRIKTTLGISRYDKASMILTEVSRYIELPDSNDAFVRFCEVLVNHGQPGLKEIAVKMISLVSCSKIDIKIDTSVTTHEAMQGNSTVSRESDDIVQVNSTVSRISDEIVQVNSTVSRESDDIVQVKSTVSRISDETMQGNSTVSRESDKIY